MVPSNKAVVRVVPADQVFGANLGYDALQAVLALSGLTWPVDSVLVVGVLAVLVRRARMASPAGDGRRL